MIWIFLIATISYSEAFLFGHGGGSSCCHMFCGHASPPSFFGTHAHEHVRCGIDYRSNRGYAQPTSSYGPQLTLSPEVILLPPTIPDSKEPDDSEVTIKARASKTIQHASNNRCNSDEIKELIEKNIAEDDVNESKRRIHKAVNGKLGNDGTIDVICSPSPFSYRIATKLFCEHSKAGITCFAYQQHHFFLQS